MAGIVNRRETGLFDGGYVKSVRNKTGHLFTNYADYAPDSRRRYFHVNSNVYGSGAYSGPLLEIDTSKYWQFAASTYTYQLSYNNRTASGHMGLRQFDADGLTAYYYMCGGTGNTTLSRTANPGDTTIYITSNSSWYTGTSTNSDLITFFPATHPKYSTPHYYSRLNVRYDGPSLVATGAGDYSMTLDAALPNWGYALPAGTPVSNGRGTNANWYIITGNTNYNNLNKWRTLVSTVRTGERHAGGDFISGTKYVRFLHLRNYTYRAETAGDSARYYLANVMAVQCKGNNAYPTRLFQRGLEGPFY